MLSKRYESTEVDSVEVNLIFPYDNEVYLVVTYFKIGSSFLRC